MFFSHCEQCHDQKYVLEDKISSPMTKEISDENFHPTINNFTRHTKPCHEKYSIKEVHKLPQRVKLKAFDYTIVIIVSYLCFSFCHIHLGKFYL